MPGTSRCAGMARFICAMSAGLEICRTISVAERSSSSRSLSGRNSGVSATRNGIAHPSRRSSRPR